MREILIRVKPLTDASKNLIEKVKKKNPLIQFRVKVPVTATAQRSLHSEVNPEKTVRDIIKQIAEKWDLKQR